MTANVHYPVMLPEVLESLQPSGSGVYVDGTFGAGGYSAAILDAAPECTVIAIDRDVAAKSRAAALQEKYGKRLQFIHGCFGDVERLLAAAGCERVDGFVLDLGVSSMQIDEGARGFSFRTDGPLDMRMNQSEGQSAADIVNSTPEEDLANIIYKYGEERLSRRIAKVIVERRAEQKFTTTAQLADVVRACVPRSKDGIDPATRTFQALRIAVNDELGELERALASAEKILKSGGRMVVVSFHSLEDRIVKDFFKLASGKAAGGSRHAPAAAEQAPARFEILTKKALGPSAREIRENARSRSAKLRAARYTGGAT